MKKILASIAVCCYLVASSGVVVDYHYCMHRLASAQLFASAKKVCGKCGMHNKRSGCCHDEIKVIKLQQDQVKAAVASYDIPSVGAVINIPSPFITASFCNIDVKNHFHNHSPPLLSAQDTYLQIGVFRI